MMFHASIGTGKLFAQKQPKDSHSDGNTVGDLIKDAGFFAVGKV
jgi:hypothetical protein